MRNFNILCHRGLYGCTDVNQEFLKMPYAKGEDLVRLPPENSYESIKAAFDAGYGVEMDACMTKDHVLIVTHTNRLPVHVKGAQPGEYVSTKTFKELSEMKTGIGGRTAPFLTYEEFLRLFEGYSDLNVNVEIKGTIEPRDALPPQMHPSVVERLNEVTPIQLVKKMIWSSFSEEMIAEMKRLNPSARVAQLFCEQKPNEPIIFEGRTERYMQFNLKNLKRIHERIPLEAVHPEIQTVRDDETLAYCVEKGLHVRTWALLERHPDRDENAAQMIQKIVRLSQKYPNLKIDIITDYAPAVKQLIDRLSVD